MELSFSPCCKTCLFSQRVTHNFFTNGSHCAFWKTSEKYLQGIGRIEVDCVLFCSVSCQKRQTHLPCVLVIAGCLVMRPVGLRWTECPSADDTIISKGEDFWTPPPCLSQHAKLVSVDLRMPLIISYFGTKVKLIPICLIRETFQHKGP